MSDRRWRVAAYLSVERWPEAIPFDGPKHPDCPEPFAYYRADDDRLDPDLDPYPASHPAAASVGDTHLGDVCPRCGVPLDWLEEVVTIDGEAGVYSDVDETGDPTPAYHPDCWRERQAEASAAVNASLGDFA